MHFLVSSLTAYLPADLDFVSAIKFIAILAFAVLFIGLLARVVIGRKSSLNHSVSAAIGILFIYAMTIVVYTFNPYDLTKYLSPLPFVRFHGETLQIFSFQGAEIPEICSQVLSMIILAFLVNLLDTFIPKGKKIVNWFGYRFISIVLSMGLHYLVTWAFNTYLPGTLVTYAPMILLGILAAMLLLGALNVILGVVLTVVNPIIGAIYAFFFSNIVGKQISKAVVTTVILCAVVYALNYLGYALISISAAALGAYIPLIIVLLVLWYVIGHLL